MRAARLDQDGQRNLDQLIIRLQMLNIELQVPFRRGLRDGLPAAALDVKDPTQLSTRLIVADRAPRVLGGPGPCWTSGHQESMKT